MLVSYATRYNINAGERLADYRKPEVLAVLLNNGTCPRINVQLLRKETVDEMFRNQIASFPNYSRHGIPAAKPGLTNDTGQGWLTAGGGAIAKMGLLA
jgi:hypothetical protein